MVTPNVRSQYPLGEMDYYWNRQSSRADRAAICRELGWPEEMADREAGENLDGEIDPGNLEVLRLYAAQKGW